MDRPSEGRRGGPRVRLVRDIQRSGFRDQVGWRGQAGARIGEAGLPAGKRHIQE
jgi:hypothetical protein